MRLIAILLGTSLTLATFAQEAKTYDLEKVFTAKPPVGVTIAETSEERQVESQVVTQNGQPMQQQQKKGTIKYARTMVIKAVDDKGEPTQEVHSYSSWSRVAGDAAPAPFTPVTVTLTRAADGSWSHDKAGQLPQDFAIWLGKELKDRQQKAGKPKAEELMLPGKPLAVGESWKMDVAKVIKAMPPMGPIKPDPEASNGTGKLVSVTEVEGKQIAVVELRLNLVVKTVPNMTLQAPAPMSFVMTQKVDLAAPYVGQQTMTMSFKLSGAPQGAPEGVLVNVDLQQGGKKTRSASK